MENEESGRNFLGEMKPGVRETISTPSVRIRQILRHPEHDRPFRVTYTGWITSDPSVLVIVGVDDQLSVVELTIPSNVPIELIAQPGAPYEPETILPEEKK